MFKRILSVLTGVVMLALMMTPAHAAEQSLTIDTTYNEDIINGHSYRPYPDTKRSAFIRTDSGYMRIYGMDNGTLLAEYYDSDFAYLGVRTVKCGLTLFGGFYHTDYFNFVMTGETNLEEDPEKEVIRITKFDKEWRKMGAVSLYGANTTTPFRAGESDFATYGDYMVIRSCHEMYAVNGERHQSNLSIRLNYASMTLIESFCGVADNPSAGYTSHSLNQFVAIDSDGTVLTLDHGDAYPRGAMLGRFRNRVQSNKVFYNNARQTFDSFCPVSYAGGVGENYTGAMIGGIECSSTSYLTVGAMTAQDASYASNTAYNAYLSVTDKNNFSAAGTRIVWLTSFQEGGGVSASNPYLVKLSDDRFLVTWNETPATVTYQNGRVNYASGYRLRYVYVDGSGNLLSEICAAPAGMRAYSSGCEPFVTDAGVMWYVSDGGNYAAVVTIAPDGSISEHSELIPDEVLAYPLNLADMRVAFRSFDPIPDSTPLDSTNIFDYALVTVNGRELTYGVDFVFRSGETAFLTNYYRHNLFGLRMMLYTVPGASYARGSFSIPWDAYYYDPELENAELCDSGVLLTFSCKCGVGCYIYRIAPDHTETCVGVINDKLETQFIDTTAEPGVEYRYYIREFTYSKEGEMIFSDPTAEITAPVIPIPSTDPPPVSTGILGDADRDGMVTILDATCIQRRLARYFGDEGLDVRCADVDSDDSLTVLDATAIQRWLARIDATLPINTHINV